MYHDLSDDGSDHRSRSDDEANNLDNGNESTNENEQKDDDENEDGTGRRIDPATSRKRIVRNPIPKLDTARLRGPKGVHTIEKYFEGFKFAGKGHEKNDLNRIMKRLEHWAHRLFPKYQFDDFLEKVEVLGTKRDLQTFLTKYRQDMLSDDVIITDANGETAVERAPSPEPVDAFDLLIAEQIEKNKQVTMSPPRQVNVSNVKVITSTNQLSTSNKQNSNTANDISLNEDIKKRIERNRQLAIERRLARLKRDEVNKKSRVEESQTSFDEIASTSNTSQIEKNHSIVESDIISIEKVVESIDEENRNAVVVDNGKMNSPEEISVIDESDSAMKNQPVVDKKITSKPLLTDEELNKTIDDAVNQFMKQKRQLN